MRSGGKKIVIGVISAVLLAAISGFVLFFSTNKITSDVNQMIDNAKKLYSEGDIENASYQMQLYCQERPDDREGWLILGDWSSENKDSEQALEYYIKAAEASDFEENDICQAKKTSVIKGTDISFKITPQARYTKDVTLTVTSQNLAPETSCTGLVTNNPDELTEDENYITTDLFAVSSEEKYLTMTGGFNCAKWQFYDINKVALTATKDKSTYRKQGITQFYNKSYSVVEIPESAVYARVTYIDKNIDNSYPTDSRLVICYGKIPQGCSESTQQQFKLPDLSENQYIEYKDGIWTFFDGSKAEKLSLDKIYVQQGYTVSQQAKLCGLVSVDYENNEVTSDKKKQYGIKFSRNDGNPVGVRLGAAKGMTFDYSQNNELYNGNGNDFDNAYPWCDIKVCNVNIDSAGNKKIIYSDDKSFKNDGSNGNVMVEIPKFYTMRIVKDNNEYIWISGTQYEGYSLEPAFIGENGQELSHIYVGAYVSSLESDKLVSASSKSPAINIAYDDILTKSENNGSGYGELDYLTLLSIQHLFLVETGTLDSSSIFSGDTGNYYFFEDSILRAFAVNSSDKTNKITLIESTLTENTLQKGDSICLLDNGWSSYKNNSDKIREITSISKNSDDTYTIEFSGGPVKIVAGKTAVTNLPRTCGKTDNDDYSCAAEAGNDGKTSFKYRGIENLYGSLCIALDNAYVANGTFTFYDASGTEFSLSDPVAEQYEHISDYDYIDSNACIKTMIYDEENPLIMIPEKVGDGATSSTYYGDFWLTSEGNGRNFYLVAGGADDNDKIAGLFHMRAFIRKGGSHYIGGRLVLR